MRKYEMHKSDMRKSDRPTKTMSTDVRARLFAGLAVLAVSGAAVSSAQAASTSVQGPTSQPADGDKKKAMATWPAEKQAAYAQWPDETKAYYWTLSPKRQKLFWGLTDPDKVALSTMSAPDQDKAWARIEGRS